MSMTETQRPDAAEHDALKKLDWEISTTRNLDGVDMLYQKSRERVQLAHDAKLLSKVEHGHWLRKLEDTVIERRTRPVSLA